MWYVHAITILVCLTAIYFMDELLKQFVPSFSLGEICIVTQGLVSFLAISLVTLSKRYFGPNDLETSLPCTVIQILTVALSSFLASLKVIPPKTNSSPIIALSFISCVVLAYSCLLTFLPNEPITWLLNELVSTEVRVCVL